MSQEANTKDVEYPKGGTIVLTKNEIYKIRTGKVLVSSFRGLQFAKRIIFFLISNETNEVHLSSKLAKHYLLVGDVCPLVITKQQLRELSSGKSDCIGRTIESVPPFDIFIMTPESYAKTKAEKKAKK